MQSQRYKASRKFFESQSDIDFFERLIADILNRHNWDEPFLRIAFEFSDAPTFNIQVPTQYPKLTLPKLYCAQQILFFLVREFGDPLKRFLICLPYGEARIDVNFIPYEDFDSLKWWEVQPFFDSQLGFRPNSKGERYQGGDYCKVQLSVRECRMLDRWFDATRFIITNRYLGELKEREPELLKRILHPQNQLGIGKCEK